METPKGQADWLSVLTRIALSGEGYRVKSSKQLSIFVVDDEQVIATTLTLILQNSGYLARAFFNPLEALAAARLEAPDLVISDVVMPQLTGVELAIQMKVLCPSCKVILFSGQAQSGDLLRSARDLGHHFHLLSKPLHPTELLRNIRAYEAAAN